MHRSRLIAAQARARALANRSVRLLPALLLAAAACREATQSQPASRLEAVSGLQVTAPVGSALPQPFIVRAVTASGKGVPGVQVSFSVTEGEAAVTPTAAETDRDGRAQAQVTLGTVATQVVVTASSLGLPSVELVITAQAGTLDRIVTVPRNHRLSAIGQTAQFRVSAEDQYRNQVTVAGVTWTSLDPELFSVSQSGVVTALQAGRTGRVVASAAGRSDTAWVSVADPSASACLGYGAPRSLAVGEVVITDADLVADCVLGAGLSAQYVAIPVHLSSTPSSTVGLELFGDGIGSGILATVVEPPSGPELQRDHAFDLSLRRAGRDVYARRWDEARAARAESLLDGGRQPAYASGAAVPTGPVGALVQVNGSSGTSCSVKEMRTARVMAVSQTAVVLADTANPPSGLTEADYQRYAAAFDTLITPVDTLAFGSATDVDGNGRIVIFFTRMVNALTPAGSSFYVAGFFHPRDVLTVKQCPASNGGEMMYMVVPDPQGQVTTASGGPARPFSRAFVDSLTIGTLAHEYQHLINAFRRAYVVKAPEDEVDWLNEGLSHIAEELVFFRAAGLQARTNIGPEHISSTERRHAFLTLQKPNFDRLAQYLSAPEQHAPWSGTDIAARGAIWSFLRYAADQRVGATEMNAWRALVSSRTSGIANLKAVFGQDILELERDWLVANLMDDHAAGVLPRYTHPSWNSRTLFVTYPLLVRTLQNRTPTAIALRGGAASYQQFTVETAREALVRLTSGGVLPRGNVQLLVVRTR